MDKKLLLIPILLASILWQPSHHYLMGHGMSMNSGIHIFVTMIPFLAALLALSKINWHN